MAHKKAGGSAKNLRDSKPKYRGVKVFGGQKVVAGNVIIRQKGTKFECGKNVYMGRDFTIHASIDGIVVFKKKKIERYDGRKYLKTVVGVDTNMPVVVAKKVPLKKTEVIKDVTVNKEIVKKEVVKKAPAKKTETVKKEEVKKVTVKKVAVKKPVAKKTETVKKTPVKKTVKK